MVPFAVSERISSIKSPIREVVVPAKKLEAAGRKIIFLNIGDPNKFDFDTPVHMKDALKAELDSGCGFYSPSEGDPDLRKTVAEFETKTNGKSFDVSDVLITSGLSEAIGFLNAVLVTKPGDEMLVPGPTYPPYIDYTKLNMGVPVAYRTDEDNGWQPDLENLRSRITDRTKCIVLINPNNPTGAVYDEKTIREVVNIAGEYDLPIVSDEIYDQLIFEGRHTPTLKVSGDVPVMLFKGFSKSYLAPGWRVGYVCFHDPHGRLEKIRDGFLKLARLRLCGCTPVQRACIAALEGTQEHLVETRRKLKERRDFAFKRLNEIEGISCTRPSGAFYIFPKVDLSVGGWKDDFDFVMDFLHAKGVVVVNGSGFSTEFGKDHFRSVILPQVEVLDEAFGLLDEFMRTKKKRN